MRILYFAPVYFDDMKQRPQQIAECLSGRNEVFYIEPTVSLVRWIVKKGRTFRGYRYDSSKNLHVIRLNGMLTFHKSVEILDIAGLNNLSEYMQIKKLADVCDVIWVGYSGWYTLVRHFKGKPVIFDKMDEEDMLVSSRLLKMTLRRNMKRITDMSRLVFASCTEFYEELSKKKETYLVPNAVPEDFVSALPSEAIAFGKSRIKIKTFGYIGTIGEWFDMDVVYRLLELDSSYEIYLVGRNYMPEIKNERVHYMGIRPHDELPEIIRHFDVCLYNFRQTSLLDTVNPVKIYEYLAMNKPVLAVSSRETRRFGEYISLYENAQKLGDKELCRLRIPFEDSRSLHRFIRENSWRERTDKIEYAVRRAIKDVK